MRGAVAAVRFSLMAPADDEGVLGDDRVVAASDVLDTLAG